MNSECVCREREREKESADCACNRNQATGIKHEARKRNCFNYANVAVLSNEPNKRIYSNRLVSSLGQSSHGHNNIDQIEIGHNQSLSQ